MIDSKTTPQEIRTITEALTGLKTIGIVTKLEQGEGEEEAFELRVPDGYLITIRENLGLNVTLIGHDKEALFNWSDIPVKQSQNGSQLIDLFFKDDINASVNPKFIKCLSDVKHDIQRKFYSTDHGDVIIHTRRHPIGTEIIIEIVDEGKIQRCLWEQSTGIVETRNEPVLTSIPF